MNGLGLFQISQNQYFKFEKKILPVKSVLWNTQIHSWILSKSLQLLHCTAGQVAKEVHQIFIECLLCATCSGNRCYIRDVMKWTSRWKAQDSRVPLDAFHLLLPPAKAIRQYSSEEKRAPLEITCLSTFEYYTKISVVKNCVLKQE